MDIIAYLNRNYPNFVFSVSKLHLDLIKICTKETHDLDNNYFKNSPVEIFYIQCSDYSFWHVINKTVSPDMMEYYIEETERILKNEIRRLKIKEIHDEF